LANSEGKKYSNLIVQISNIYKAPKYNYIFSSVFFRGAISHFHQSSSLHTIGADEPMGECWRLQVAATRTVGGRIIKSLLLPSN
jgi:hypothetical protein